MDVNGGPENHEQLLCTNHDFVRIHDGSKISHRKGRQPHRGAPTPDTPTFKKNCMSANPSFEILGELYEGVLHSKSY